MNNLIRTPGIPPNEKQDSVNFSVLKGLSYSNRRTLYLSLLALGFLFQLLMMKVNPGAIFLVCATVLNLTRGYDNLVNLKAFHSDKDWTQVDMEQINRIEDIERKTKSWQSDIFDINSGKGIFMLILTIFGLVVVYLFLGASPSYSIVRGILIFDATILLLPMWFSGTRKVFKLGDLNIKVGIIKNLAVFFRTIKKDGENFKPALKLARDKNGKSVPKDSRFTITFDNMPEGFYGIQAQININKVEGSSYPYFYCVIAAKPGFGLDKYVSEIPVPGNVDINCEKDQSAEVIVIRQHTTKKSGYHTKIYDCQKILEAAVAGARVILRQ